MSNNNKFKVRDVRIEASALYSSLLDAGIDITSGGGGTGFTGPTGAPGSATNTGATTSYK